LRQVNECGRLVPILAGHDGARVPPPRTGIRREIHHFKESPMNKLLAALAAGLLAVASVQVLAAEPKKDAAPMHAPVKLEKPASVSEEAWSKMSDAEKKRVVEAAAKGETKSAKKPKKGGC
jgi:hypothetical protein